VSSSRPVGYLDSGIVGVTVLRETVKILPNENYYFFSDSVNNPYGDKSDEEIIARCRELVGYLLKEKDCKAIVIACNTASAKAVKALRAEFSGTPIVAIEPAYKMVHDHNPEGETLVMATRGTLESEKFRRLYYAYDNHNTALLSCIGLADLIEQDRQEELRQYLHEKLGDYAGRVQNVVLGCTHYPLAKEQIREVLGDVRFFDGAVGVSNRLRQLLAENGLLNDGAQAGSIGFEDSSPTAGMREAKKERFFKLLNEE
jgi:glutamate racemase